MSQATPAQSKLTIRDFRKVKESLLLILFEDETQIWSSDCEWIEIRLELIVQQQRSQLIFADFSW